MSTVNEKPDSRIISGKKLTKGQLSYEQERAKQAGVSLEKWMAQKAKVEAEQSKKTVAKPPKKAGLIGRLLDRARKPI